MYEILKNVSTLNDWVFEYSRHDYQNLFEEIEGEKLHLFCDPIAIQHNISDSNTIESYTYSGRFMLLYSSDIDEDYDTHYCDYIKPLLSDSQSKIITNIRCKGISQITQWNTTEIINYLDYNFSGIIVNYIVTEDV